MGCNVLAMGKGKVIMLEGNPITQKRLEAEGVEVKTYNGSEISIKGAGPYMPHSSIFKVFLMSHLNQFNALTN